MHTAIPARVVLEGVPRVHFYEGGARCPEDIILPSVMRALMEYFGEQDFGCRHCLAHKTNCRITCSYAFFMGVTGAGSYLSWKDGWHGDNNAIFYMSDDAAAPERRAFQAAGYAHEWVMKDKQGGNEDEFRRRIVESIRDQRRPVLGYGVIGPPEPSIITGYDEGGDVLIGWSFFQNIPGMNEGVEAEPSGCFRKRDWYRSTECLLVIGDHQPRPAISETYRDALAWALRVARTPMVKPQPDAPEWYQHRHNGLAAYSAWARHVLRDEDFPAGDDAALRAHHQVHNDAVGAVAEARWYGSQFLIQASDPDHLHYRMCEDLLHAAALYAGEHDLMWKLWDLAGGNGNPNAHTHMADPAVRRQMADVILEARDKDARALAHIEKALTMPA